MPLSPLPAAAVDAAHAGLRPGSVIRRGRRVALLSAGIALAGCIGVAAPAFAQINTGGSTAPEIDKRRAASGAKITAEVAPEEKGAGAGDERRMSDSYQPKGIDLGMFLLLPKWENGMSANSNIYATRSDVKSDFYWTSSPEFSLRSRFSQHELNLRASAERVTYWQEKRNNQTNYSVDAGGRYDVQPGVEATLFTQYYSRHEDRSSPDEAGGVEPTPIQGFVSRLGVKQEMGRFTLSGDITSQRLTFDPVATSTGSIIPNQDRDRWEFEGKVRGAYELSPGYAFVVQASANSRQYDDAFDRNGYDRSSRGYRVEAGVGVDISKLLRGDFLLGYLQQNYKDARLTDPSGLSVRASFNWTPDKLVVVVPALERVVAETTRLGSSSLVQTTGSVLVRYEAARNILLTAYGAATYGENEGLPETNWTYEARLRGTYSFTPEFFVGAEAAQKTKIVSNDDGGYNQSVFTLRLGLQL